MSDSDPEGRVRDRAYYLWLQAGSPEGRHEEFWHESSRLEAELREAEAANAAPGHGAETGITDAAADLLSGKEPPGQKTP